jgi:hypothetical protein
MGLPNEVNSALIGAAAAGGYQIDQSLRWRGSSSIYLSQSVNSAPTTSTSATLSFWMKASQQNNGYLLFDCRNGSVDWGFQGGIKYESGFGWGDATFGSAENATNVTNYWTLNQNSSQPALRDPSAWYHVVVIWDGNNGTSTSRMQVYVNGSQSYFYNYYGSIGSGASCPWTRNGYTLKVGGSSNSQFYMADLYCIDGQGLSPGNFAETDLITGAWIPKKYSGSYGNNGFYCKFDPSATNGIGHDHSGNGNNFSPTGFSTSGTGTDVMSDTPTNNWCTLNPLIVNNSTYLDPAGLSEGNLVASHSSVPYNTFCAGTFNLPSSGKWYWEVKQDAAPTGVYMGIGRVPWDPTSDQSARSGMYAYQQDGNKFKLGTASSYGSSWTNGDIVGVAVDMDNTTISFYKNGTSQGNAFTDIDTAYDYVPMSWANDPNRNVWVYNFGQRAFAYTPPTGYKALNTANLPAPDIADGSQYFDTKLYTGDSNSTQAITGLGFQPDFVWIKNRGSSTDHLLFDAVRGVTKVLKTVGTGPEETDANAFQSFDSSGFTLGTSSSGNPTKANGNTYVAWCVGRRRRWLQ